jgi:hypothetical protein
MLHQTSKIKKKKIVALKKRTKKGSRKGVKKGLFLFFVALLIHWPK